MHISIFIYILQYILLDLEINDRCAIPHDKKLFLQALKNGKLHPSTITQWHDLVLLQAVVRCTNHFTFFPHSHPIVPLFSIQQQQQWPDGVGPPASPGPRTRSSEGARKHDKAQSKHFSWPSEHTDAFGNENRLDWTISNVLNGISRKIGNSCWAQWFLVQKHPEVPWSQLQSMPAWPRPTNSPRQKSHSLSETYSLAAARAA